jgi:hypothetical protein
MLNKKRLKRLHCWLEALESAEGGIRSGLFLEVPGRPSCGFSSGYAFVTVFGCSLMFIGVPVNVLSEHHLY